MTQPRLLTALAVILTLTLMVKVKTIDPGDPGLQAVEANAATLQALQATLTSLQAKVSSLGPLLQSINDDMGQTALNLQAGNQTHSTSNHSQVGQPAYTGPPFAPVVAMTAVKGTEYSRTFHPVSFTDISLDLGHGFNRNTDHYVAPISGTYIISLWASSHSNQAVPVLGLGGKRGGTLAEVHGSRITLRPHHELGVNIALHLAKGDEVWAHTITSSQGYPPSSSLYTAQLSAYLLHQD